MEPAPLVDKRKQWYNISNIEYTEGEIQQALLWWKQKIIAAGQTWPQHRPAYGEAILFIEQAFEAVLKKEEP